MEFHHRKLIADAIICQSLCNDTYSYIPPPSSLDKEEEDYNDHNHAKSHRSSIIWTISLSVLAITFLAIICYVIYVKFFSGHSNNSRRSEPQAEETPDEFISEDQSLVLDHPIWYIRTAGLQQSIIRAIAVCKYKRSEGLIDGAECSVCLNEFIEDETLRLLPKCNHAFHVDCIDTWLRSHTNCPLCRAPIVNSTAGVSSTSSTTWPEPGVENSSSLEITHVGISENSGESSRAMEGGVHELRIAIEEEAGESCDENVRKRCGSSNGEVEEGMVHPRRSVSMDDSSAASINLAISNPVPIELDGDSYSQPMESSETSSKRTVGNGSSSKLKGCSCRRTRSLQSSPIFLRRSLSFNGKILLSKHSSTQKSSVPLRSF